MTKKELLENEAFKNAKDDAVILIPNGQYQEGVDERDAVDVSRIWDCSWKNVLEFS